jgi:glucokinase
MEASNYTDTMNELAIGIDIGGTNTKYGLVNHRGEILAKGELKTDHYTEIEFYIDALHQSIKTLIDQYAKGATIKGIGIGAPNGNFYTGTIEYAPNLHWKGIIYCKIFSAFLLNQ